MFSASISNTFAKVIMFFFWVASNFLLVNNISMLAHSNDSVDDDVWGVTWSAIGGGVH